MPPLAVLYGARCLPLVALCRAAAFLNLSLSRAGLSCHPALARFARSRPRNPQTGEMQRECRMSGCVCGYMCVHTFMCARLRRDRDGESQSGGERRTTRVIRQRK